MTLATKLVVYPQNGRLHSGDHVLQIGEVNVRGMGSEQVASVLRQSGSHVRLIVARPVLEPSPIPVPHAPIVPTHQLDDHIQQINRFLEGTDIQAISEDQLQQQIQQQQSMDGLVQVHIVRVMVRGLGSRSEGQGVRVRGQ